MTTRTHTPPHPSPVRLAALIPAAGLSSRMGTFKPLEPVAGRPLIQWTIESVWAGGVSRVCVVLGRRARDVRMALEAAELACGRQGSLYFVENISYTTTDMLYSLQLGLGALLAKTDPPNALFVLPGDMAGVSQTTFRTLAKRAQHSPARVLRPTCNGITGHPILIRSECLKPVLGYSGEGGLRQALAGHPVESVETGDIGVLLDADEPADLEVLRKHMAALRHGNSQNVATADTGRLPGPQVPTV